MTAIFARPMPVTTMPVDFKRYDFHPWPIPIDQAHMSRRHSRLGKVGRKPDGVKMNRAREGKL